MKMLLPIIIGVTGHRNLPSSSTKAVHSQVMHFWQMISSTYPNSPIRLVSGLAEGADRLVADSFLSFSKQRALARKAHPSTSWNLQAVLPAPREVYFQDFPQSIEECERLLSESAKVVELPVSSVSVDSGKIARPDYEGLAQILVERCHIILALWDGLHLPLTGGTSHVVRCKLGTESEQPLASPYYHAGPVFHIKVSREDLNTKPDSEATQIPVSTGSWLLPQIGLDNQSSYLNFIANLDELNRDVVAAQSDPKVERLSTFLFPNETIQTQISATNQETFAFARLQAIVDAIAVKLEKRRRSLLALLYVLGIFLAVCLAAALDNVAQLFMITGYLILLFLMILAYRRLMSNSHSDHAFETRLLAEVLRSELYLRLSKNSKSMAHGNSALERLMMQQVQEIGWVREALRALPQTTWEIAGPVRDACERHWVSEYAPSLPH